VTGLPNILRKLRLIAVSDLATGDKLRYVLNAAGRGTGQCTYRLRGGVSVTLRKGTTDTKVFDEIFVEGAYAPCLAALPDTLDRVTLIDLGANIGLSVLYLARELDARAVRVDHIIAVEPDPDNFRMLAENLRRTGLADCCTALRAFAGPGAAFAELHDSGNGAWGMRMGPLSEGGIPVLPLAEIGDLAKTSAPVLLKCDIEGAELQLFLHIRDWEHLIRYIFLELHTEFLPIQQMLACLASSGFEWTIHGTAPAGASIVMLVLERGERRKRPDVY
jgi:FkbM family methyltransferase